ncbi:hypothetical protein EVAR_19914_1 [Eumeta japonica]|uniref:Uncharacterized protein n=1 Tax=Eumeta variegata TaxID=151549 RepID=A0A4C1ZKM9_EUMVA|nr:hypothetical protein EVAR_19914_1 [Eumeta japonica]
MELAYFNKDESCEDDPRPGRPVTLKAREQSYRSDVRSYRAECCFYRQCICPHGAVSRQALKDTGLEMTTHPTAQI